MAKGQTRWTGFDDKIISMYARGMTTREIQGHLEEIYGIEVSPTLISNVTDAVVEEVKLWQGRPLEEIYPSVYLDALMVKVRDEGHVQNQAIYVVLGVNLEGQKEVLGLWVAQSEGAKFWLQVLTELQNRGVKDILIACVDGLKGFPRSHRSGVSAHRGAVVHRASGAGFDELRAQETAQARGTDLQLIYQRPTVARPEQHLAELESKWKAYPSVSQVWRRNWARITPFFNFRLTSPCVYTTNSVESLNRSLRKIIKTRGGFPNEEAALKLGIRFWIVMRDQIGGEEVATMPSCDDWGSQAMMPDFTFGGLHGSAGNWKAARVPDGIGDCTSTSLSEVNEEIARWATRTSMMKETGRTMRSDIHHRRARSHLSKGTSASALSRKYVRTYKNLSPSPLTGPSSLEMLKNSLTKECPKKLCNRKPYKRFSRLG